MERRVEEELRTMVREFRASVSEDLHATHQRMDQLAHDLRTRINTLETAVLNTLRDNTRETDRRLSRLEQQWAVIDERLDGHDDRFDAIDARLDTIDARLDTIDARLDRHDERFDAIDGTLQEILGLLRA